MKALVNGSGVTPLIYKPSLKKSACRRLAMGTSSALWIRATTLVSKSAAFSMLAILASYAADSS